MSHTALPFRKALPWTAFVALLFLLNYMSRSTLTPLLVPLERDLGEMGWVARNGFVNFTDREIADVYEFLRRDQGLPFADPASGERE